MEYRENGTHFNDYVEWEIILNAPYDYKRKGFLQHVMSNRIVNTDNVILKNVLRYYEQTLINLMQYVDRLKHFKNYHWKNR
jgi:hypothetical protein